MRNYSAYRILCLTQTWLNAKQPSYLYDIIKLKENTRQLMSSNSFFLSNQKCNLDSYGKRRFHVLAPILWNKLSLPLRRCNSIKTFKKAVKKHQLYSSWDLRLPCPLYLRWCSCKYFDHICICQNNRVF